MCLGSEARKGETAVRIGDMDNNTTRVLLFDIDGTLMDSANEVTICLSRAMEDVYGTAGPIESYDMHGKTDWQIVTELMDMAGFEAVVVEAGLSKVFGAYARHVELAAPTLKMRTLPGVTDLLRALVSEPNFILGLVTGNARAAVPNKLRAVGLDPGLFTFGAFGDDHRDRNRLPPLALYRLEQILGARVPSESALVIGDTPRDIECARSAGLKVLCVATGSYPRDALARCAPDYLLDDMVDTDTVLLILKEF